MDSTPPPSPPEPQGASARKGNKKTEKDQLGHDHKGRSVHKKPHQKASDLKPDSRPESPPVKSKTVHVESSGQLPPFLKTADEAQARLLQLLEEKRIPSNPKLMMPTIMAWKAVKDGDLEQWVEQDIANAFAAICISTQLLQGKSPENHKHARTLIKLAFLKHPEYCKALVMCWECYEVLATGRELSESDQSVVQERLMMGDEQHLGTASWILALAEMGFIRNLPCGNPRQGLKRYHSASFCFNRVQRPVGYHQAPVDFGFLDSLTRKIPVDMKGFPRVFNLESEESFYQLLPAILASASHFPGYEGKYESLEESEAIDSASLDTFKLAKAVRIVSNLILLVHSQREAEKQRLITSAKRYSSESQKLFDHDPFRAQDFLERARGQLRELDALDHDMSPAVDPASRKSGVKVKKHLEQIVSKVPPITQSFIYSCLGMLHECSLIQTADPLRNAMPFYQKACQVYPQKELREEVERYLASTGQIRKVIDFLEASRHSSSDLKEEQLKVEYYQSRLHSEKRKGRITDEELAVICRELGIDDGKLQAKYSSDTHLKDDGSGGSSNGTSGGSSSDSESSDIETDPVTLDEPKQERVSDPSTGQAPVETVTSTEPEQDDFQLVEKKTSSKNRKLLSGHWHRRIPYYLGLSHYYREDKDDLEKEHKTLKVAIEKLGSVAGIERLHEELAWNLIWQHRSIRKSNDLSIKEQSLQLLDEAEEHLEFCIRKKLGLSDGPLPNIESMKEQARTRRDSFKKPEEQEEFMDGVHFIMSSLAHVQSERQLINTSGSRKKLEEKMRGYYSGKTI